MTNTGAFGGVPAQRVYDALEESFTPWKYSDVFPKKGLQYHNTDVIRRVYVATFASVPVIRQLLDTGESNVLLYTHHPLPPRPYGAQAPSEIPPELLEAMKERGGYYSKFKKGFLFRNDPTEILKVEGVIA